MKQARSTITILKKNKILQKLTDLFIRISSPLVMGAAVVILIFIFLLSIVLPQNEKKELLQKTDDFCISTAIGISSVTIEALSGSKKDIVRDYLINLKNQNINGLKDVQVIEFVRGQGKNSSAQAGSGIMLAAFVDQNTGRPVKDEKYRKLLEIKKPFKQIVTNQGQIYFDYYYPISWNVKIKGENRRISLGVSVLRFHEQTILEHYYAFRQTATWITAGALFSGILIIGFYLVLIKLLRLKIAEIHELSITDALTQIYNRKKFHDSLDVEIKRQKRYGGQLSLIMFDIDHFKSVNDTFGHDVGDLVLVGVTQVVKRAVRQTDLFARWGGEEFMILVPQTGLKETADFAERIRQDIEMFKIESVGHVTCSFGVTLFDSSETADVFLKKADTALYQSKEGGRNLVTVL